MEREGEGHHLKQRDMKLLLLSSFDANLILLCYALIIIFGVYIASIYAVQYSLSEDKEKIALITGLSMSVVGSAVFYTRKLYQACINDTYTFVHTKKTELPSNLRIRRKGTIAYFIMRPLFGMAFSIVIYAFWRLSIAASDEIPLKPSAGFLYTTITLGFLSGFSAGRMLKLLEGYGANRLGPMLGKDG